MMQRARDGDEGKRDWGFGSDRDVEPEIKPKPSPDPELDGEPLSVSDYEESFIPIEGDF